MNDVSKHERSRMAQRAWLSVLLVFGLSLGINGQGKAALTDGLVAYWSFDDCTAPENTL